MKSRAVARLTVTPGCSVASCMKFRPLSGSSAICVVDTTPPATALLKSMLVAAPSTVTFSMIAPTFSERSALTSRPISSVRFSRFAEVNPESSAVTE